MEIFFIAMSAVSFACTFFVSFLYLHACSEAKQKVDGFVVKVFGWLTMAFAVLGVVYVVIEKTM